MRKVTLGEVCSRGSSNIAQKDLNGNNGKYPIYGASGFIKCVDFYHQGKEYVAVVKDGAGIGRTMLLPANSSVIGTMQYLIPNEDVDVRYLYYAVLNMNLSKYFSGATIPHIYYRDYQNEEFMLPSMSEQGKKADNLQKIERLITVKQTELTKLNDLVKSRFVEMFGDPEVNDKQWPVYKLDKLCDVGSSKRIYQNEQSSEGVAFWRISDLVSKMDTGIAESGLFIPEERYEELKEQGLVPVEGDILVTARGTLGRCYIISAEDQFYFQDGMISWLSGYKHGITPLYLQYLFMMQGIKRQIDAMQAGSTVAYLSIAMLKKLDIMVPDNDAQRQFSSFVAQTDKSKLAVQKELEKLELLKKSLMQQYFG